MITKFIGKKGPFCVSTITIALLLAFVGNKCKVEISVLFNRRRKTKEMHEGYYVPYWLKTQ